ncbi:carboxymuconolactone decarboxylase family protein [Roseomonas sp. 18066]|uniref:(R)-mandelonitrile lyase n=1 Tax=Roseomonas sp. 18066 TaxID=2681412 RepID=UPI00135B69C4|nr:carboxymuconolactone decarboxylase family protein [Roseomonas sp. 18066]
MRLLGMAFAASMAAADGAAGQTPQTFPRMAPEAARQVSPPLAELTDRVLFGEIWRREALGPRDRSLVTVATLIANGRAAQLRGHLGRALDNGVTPLEISETIAHLAFYAGWPAAISAVAEAKAVYDARGIAAGPALAEPAAPLELEPLAEARRRAAVEAAVAGVAPPLAAQTNDTLFGELWRRPGLAPRDRSLVTLVALVANGQAEQLPFHLERALEAGLTRPQLAEVITHLAFYAGWPRAMSAVPVVARVLAARDAAAAPAPAPAPELVIQRRAAHPAVPGPAGNFTGTPQVGSRFQVEPGSAIGGGLVAFPAGARTNWHSHPRGQTLIIVSGEGWVQRDGGAAEPLRPGDVVWIPPGLRHWHGATAASAMAHVAIAGAVEGNTTTWLEPVTAAQYPGP